MANTVKRLALLLFFCSLGSAQLINRGFNFVGPGVGGPLDNRAFGCMNWALTYSVTGFSAVSIQLESAPDASVSSTTSTPGAFILFAGTIQTGTGLTTNPATITNPGGTIQGIGYFPWVRANLTSATGSGYVTGVIQCQAPQPAFSLSPSSGANQPVIGPTAAGSPPTTAPVLVAGTDATNVRTILTDASGRQIITCASGCASSTPAATFSASTAQGSSGTVFATGATDFFCITGSGTKTIQLTQLRVTFINSATSNVKANAALFIRSTANSGGTTTALTAVPLDSNNAAATASVVIYTANPASLGTAVGKVATWVTDNFGTTLTGSPNFPNISATWGAARGVQPITLRGAAQEACLNYNAGNSAGDFFNIESVEWTEQ